MITTSHAILLHNSKSLKLLFELLCDIPKCLKAPLLQLSPTSIDLLLDLKHRGSTTFWNPSHSDGRLAARVLPPHVFKAKGFMSKSHAMNRGWVKLKRLMIRSHNLQMINYRGTIF